MRMLQATGLSLLLVFLVGLSATAQAADREKLLSDPGVFGTFAVFAVDDAWWRLDREARAKVGEEIKGVLDKHGEQVVADLYLLRGLSDRADLMLRLHSTDLARHQHLVLDFLATSLGRYLHNVYTFHGITKPANYVPGFSDDLKAAMKTPPDPGPKPYAIVVPIRKDADWWNQPQAARLEMMQEHAQVTTPYLKTVKRKLYHASGLDDLDFITYFETARLDDFHNLILALERIKENRHNRRFGHPILLGTVCTVGDLAEVFAR
ncbi:Chlorite dismutase [Nitrospira tepida]|uniref:Chlorite dismutase n=1 Tax=Nitrospira tepida TaxID=2973512 RepID=A0AA86MX90_9BACT|nr:chlorite dismutase family protein [Nitrospira tepida]CAI4030564.1 Chlorite dismutase [Nitrospira tepida]